MIILKVNTVEYEISVGGSVSYVLQHPEELKSVILSSDPGSTEGYNMVMSIEEASIGGEPWTVILIKRESGHEDVVIGSLSAHSMRATTVYSDGKLYKNLTWN